MTIQDAEYEAGMEFLYSEFAKTYESEFIFNRVYDYYKENLLAAKPAILNLEISKKMFKQEDFSSALIHSMIFIEVILKNLLYKPVISAMAIDERASHFLCNVTISRKSIPSINNKFYEILDDVLKFKLKEEKWDDQSKKVFDEIAIFQDKRNKTIHEGVLATKSDAELIIELSNYILIKLIPKVLTVFNFRLENTELKYGRK